MIYICVNCYLLFVFHLSPSDADRVLIGCSSGARYDVTLISTGEYPAFILSLSPVAACRVL